MRKARHFVPWIVGVTMAALAIIGTLTAEIVVARLIWDVACGLIIAGSWRSHRVDAVFDRGRQIGYDSGYRAGRRVAKPVVVPIREHEQAG